VRVTPLVASRFRSDGGAMFGLVPKPIWAKRLPPDEHNAVAQYARVLLIEWPDGRRGLLDTGCGDPARFSEPERRRHGLTDDWPLLAQLAACGIEPESIDVVILSHLHWDHAGGLVRLTPEGGLAPLFPWATLVLHALEWEDAMSGDPLLYKSYPDSVTQPLRAWPWERVRLVQADDHEVVPGVRLVRSGGHTRGHCCVHIEARDMVVRAAGVEVETPRLVYAGDVCPTQHHLRLVFQTAYDTFPLQARQWKYNWLPRIARDEAILCFDHDPDLWGARIKPDAQEEYRVTQSWPT
jgi:glyoxylase-like metal-dependent hydrolase (beta-lactamase superfamily II)